MDTHANRREVGAVEDAVARALGGAGSFVLAVSGGLDSMVLLHAASRVLDRARLLVASFDHGTGEHAMQAISHVERSCRALGMAFAGERSARALRSEAELREARWAFLRAIAGEARTIVTAHTADDQLESVLMRVLRGAGARGLAGLYAESEIVRPFVALGRPALSAYASARDVTWVEDPSNQSRAYLRNRVRHDLLPALVAARPSLPADLLAVAREAAKWRGKVERIVSEHVGVDVREDGGLDVPITDLAGMPDAGLRMLWPAIAARAGRVLDRRGIARLAAFTARARAGGRMQLSGGWEAIRSRDTVQLRPAARPSVSPVLLSSSGTVDWANWTFRAGKALPSADASTAWLPRDDVITVRSWRPGDAIRTHRQSHRTVKRCLSDARITGDERRRWPVVVVNDEVVWIPGVRRAPACARQMGSSGVCYRCDHANR